MVRVFTELLGFKNLNPKGDAPIIILQNGNTVITIDRYKDQVPEDYVTQAIINNLMDLKIFRTLYDSLNTDKSQKKKRKTS